MKELKYDFNVQVRRKNKPEESTKKEIKIKAENEVENRKTALIKNQNTGYFLKIKNKK